MVKTAFLFSPPYSVPAISTNLSSRLIAITVSLLHPCFSGFALKLGILIIVKSLEKFFKSAFLGFIKRCLKNKLCQANSEINLTFILCSCSAPPYKS